MKAIIYAAVAFCAGAAVENSAQAQVDSSLDEVVITAKSLENELPQQLSHYGTRVDIDLRADNQERRLFGCRPGARNP